MMSRLKLIHLAMLALLIHLFAVQGYSCTCGDATVAQQRDNASAVFMGTPIRKMRSDQVEKNGVQITFKVNRVWKGDVEKEVTVYTAATSDLYPFENLCAPSFKIGKDYVVFALGSDKFTTDVCTGTLLASEAKNTIRELGKSRSPNSKNESKSQTRGHCWASYLKPHLGDGKQAVNGAPIPLRFTSYTRGETQHPYTPADRRFILRSVKSQ
jgi:hypothetical protein